MRVLLALILTLTVVLPSYSHGGRTDKSGCHNETRTGTYHCH